MDLLKFDKEIIYDLIKYKNTDFEWKDMLRVIRKNDKKIKKKKWIRNRKLTKMRIIDYNPTDTNMCKFYLEFISKELQNNTYKIFGISGIYKDKKWGHYMIIGKNNKREIITFDPTKSIKIVGIENILKDFLEDNVQYLIDYYDGLIINLS